MSLDSGWLGHRELSAITHVGTLQPDHFVSPRNNGVRTHDLPSEAFYRLSHSAVAVLTQRMSDCILSYVQDAGHF